MGNVCGCGKKQRKESKPTSVTLGLQNTFTVNSRPEAELLKMFKENDTDKDGKITAKELQQCLKSFNVDLSPGEVCVIFSKVDQDKDMLLNAQEYLAAVRECPDLDKLKGVFSSFDKDQNGTISKEEFFELAQTILKPEESTKETVNVLFSSIDADGDGQISFQEFTVLLKNPPDNIDKLFDTIDVNKDGVIEKHELKQSYLAMGIAISDKELDAIFKATDTNQDQMLSRTEFRKKFLEQQQPVEKEQMKPTHPIQRQQPLMTSPQPKPAFQEPLTKTQQKLNEPKFQNVPPGWSQPKLAIQRKT